ncbi:MAG: hypothetical protein ACOCUU_00280 [Nanoarchaeota archaeon]
MLLETLSVFFVEYIIIISFLGGFLAGGEAIIIFSMIASDSFFKLSLVFIFGFCGFIIADNTWFYLGRKEPLKFLKNIPYIGKTYIKSQNMLEKITSKNFFNSMLLAKLFYGLAIPTMMHLGRTSRDIRKFFISNVLVNLLLMFLFVVFGWGIGRGLAIFTKAYQNLNLTLLLLILVFILIYLIRLFLKKHIQKLKKILNKKHK